MSSFRPLNLADDSKKDSIEQHTRELQTEQAIQLFQKALDLHKQGDLVQSYRTYTDVFQLEIISNHYFEEESLIKGLQNGSSNTTVDELQFLSSNLKRLRYLLFRNRAMLYLDMLREFIYSNAPELPSEQEMPKRAKRRQLSLANDVGVKKEIEDDIKIEEKTQTSQDSNDVIVIEDDGTKDVNDGATEKVDNRSSEEVKDVEMGEPAEGLPEILRENSPDTSKGTTPENDDRKIGEGGVTGGEGEENIQDNAAKDDNISPDKLNGSKLAGDLENSNDSETKELKEEPGIQIKQEPNSPEIIEISFSPGPEEPDPEIFDSISNGDFGIIPQICELPSREETTDKVKQMFYTVIDDLCIALVYEEADEGLLRVLHELFVYLRQWKLARFTSEYVLAGPEESDDLFGLIGRDPEAIASIEALENWLHRGEKSQRNLDKVDAKYRYLDEIRQDIRRQVDATTDVVRMTWVFKNGGGCRVERDFSDTPSSFEGIDWTTLVDQFDSATKSTLLDDDLVREKRGRRSNVDGYWFTSNPIERVNLGMVDGEPVEVEVEEPIQAPAAPDTVPESVVTAPSEQVEEEVVEASEPSRASKRLARIGEVKVDVPDIPICADYFHESTVFFKSLSSSIGVEVGVNISKWISEDARPAYIEGLLTALNSWSPELSSALTGNRSDAKTTDRIKLLDVISSFGVEDGKGGAQKPTLTNENVQNAVEDINHHRYNYFQAKVAIISALLNAEDQLALQFKWPHKLSQSVEKWVFHINQYLFEQVVAGATSIGVAVGIYELLVNTYIVRKDAFKEGSSSKKFRATSVAVLESRDLVERWRNLLQNSLSPEDGTVYLRFLWAQLHQYKCANIYSSENAFVLASISQDLAPIVGDTNVAYPNYPSLASLTSTSVNDAATTLSVLDMFSKILAHDTTRSVGLLEQILIGADVEDPILQAIRQFLSLSVVDMKLSLWGILFSAYASSRGDKPDFERGFNQFISQMVEYLDNPNTRHDSRSVVWVVGGISSTLNQYLTTYLEPREWKLPEKPSHQSLAHLLRLFELVYMFSIHEEASMMSSRYTSVANESKHSYDTFKDALVQLATILVLYVAEIHPDRTLETYSLIHDHLGSRHLCSTADGLFLRVGQQLLFTQSSPSGEMAQIIYCRYHYQVTIAGEVPRKHGTPENQSSELDKATTIELARIILPQCFKANTIIHPPKHDVRGIIDGFNQVIGLPEYEKSPVLAKNSANLELFFDYTSISAKFLKEAFHGQVKSVDIVTPKDPNTEIIHLGLYYLQALVMFVQFKIKKKSMQSRIVDLETIIGLLKADLVYNTNRFESWYLLGQAYGFLVEDDVIWTADKLNVVDRKVVTANFQRKSILSYLMAINQVGTAPREQVAPVIDSLTQDFAKEVYTAVKTPMDGMAFKVLEKPRFVNDQSPKFVQVSPEMSVSKELLMRVIQQSLHIAIKADPDDWENYWYLAKVQKSLGKSPELILETIRRGGSLAYLESADSSDRIIEPHYMLVSTLYKMVKADKVSVPEAVAWMKQDEVAKAAVTGEVEVVSARRRNGRRKKKKEAEGEDEDEDGEDGEEKKEEENKAVEEAVAEVAEVKHVDFGADKENAIDVDDEDMNGDLPEEKEKTTESEENGKSHEKPPPDGEEIDPQEDDQQAIDNGNDEKDVDALAVKYNKVEEPASRRNFEHITTKREFYELTVVALKLVKDYDKRKWHHRCKYRLAHILFEEFGDAQAALEPMNTLVFIKVTGKQLITIWKPEFERAGKHFWYTFEYASLYIKLLTATHDLQSLMALTPRLRKSNSIMVHLYTAWEQLCSSYNLIMRGALGMGLKEFNYVESWLTRLSLADFSVSANKMIEKFKSEGIPKELEIEAVLLSTTNEMKKLNNGFGPTSVIDDSMASLFLKCYEWYDKHVPKEPTNETQSVAITMPVTGATITQTPVDTTPLKTKRMAKKELYPFATDLVKQTKSQVDELKPKIHINPWVEVETANKAEERRILELQQRELEAQKERELQERLRQEQEEKNRISEIMAKQAEEIKVMEARNHATMIPAQYAPSVVPMQQPTITQWAPPPQPVVIGDVHSKRSFEESDNGGDQPPSKKPKAETIVID